MRSQNLFFWGEIRPLNGKFLKFRYETIHTDSNLRFRPAKFCEIGKAVETKPVHHQNPYFWPPSAGPWSDLAENFMRLKDVLRIPLGKLDGFWRNLADVCQVSSKSIQFSETYTRKCLLRWLQYRRKAFIAHISWSIIWQKLWAQLEML